MIELRSPLQGTVVRVAVGAGDSVRVGEEIIVVESMKMEHGVECAAAGVVQELHVGAGDQVNAGQVLALLLPLDAAAVSAEASAAGEERTGTQPERGTHVRPDLAAVRERHQIGLDEARPEAVERRRKTRQGGTVLPA